MTESSLYLAAVASVPTHTRTLPLARTHAVQPLRSEPVERENPELKEDSGTCVVGGREATFVVEQFATNSSIEDRFHAPVGGHLHATINDHRFTFMLQGGKH
jgi:hypothetical protein